MQVMKAFNSVRGNLAAKTLHSVFEDGMNKLGQKSGFDDVFSAVKSVTENEKAQNAYFRLSEFKAEGRNDSRAVIYHNMPLFMHKATKILGEKAEEGNGFSQNQKKEFFDYMISNPFTKRLYHENPNALIQDLNNMSKGASGNEGLEFLSFVESQYSLSSSINRCSNSSNSMAYLSGFFENMINDEISEDVVINHLRGSNAFQTACQSEKFMEAIYHNVTLRDARVSDSGYSREPM